jgi:two-component system, OmpR family, phosphate regulon sensor histidine kinase PhoR
MALRSYKIAALIIGTIVLPVILYVVYEISNLKENEKVIEQIYKEQLDAIIFSINQYSFDAVNSIIDQVSNDYFSQILEEGSKNQDLQFSGIEAFYISEIGSGEYTQIYASDGFEQQQDLVVLEQANADLIQKLQSYLEAGYRKVEPLPLNADLQLFYSVVKSPEGKPNLLVGFIRPQQYISEILSPKLQQISDQKLIISFCEAESGEVIYASDTLKKNALLFEKMWLFSNLKVGITSKADTVSDLVNERMRSNLLASGLMLFLLVIGLFLIFRNLNKEMRLAQQKTDFVTNVSHELRTPLALISMFAETLMLGRAKNEEKKQEYTELIYKETSRLTTIVNRILNFAKIEANKRTYALANMDAVALLKEIMEDYSHHLRQNGFEYQLEVGEKPIYIEADKDAIYEAVVNLLDNAVKYSTDVKNLKVSLLDDGQEIHIAVEDKGMGIPNQKLEAIFDKFYRVTEGDLYTVKGTGLGLAIVKHIMQAHGGDVKVKSELGQGSIFSLVFKKRNT